MRQAGFCLLVSLALVAAIAHAQERFSPFVPSDQENVERMLKLARLKDDDIVVDLGSGDGRIVLTAARMNRKLRGWGVDVDEELVLPPTPRRLRRASPTASSSSTATRSTPICARPPSSPCGCGRSCSACCGR